MANRQDSGETLRWFEGLKLLRRLNSESVVPGWRLLFKVYSQDPTSLKELKFRNTDKRVLDHLEASKKNGFMKDGLGIKAAQQWLERSSKVAR